MNKMSEGEHHFVPTQSVRSECKHLTPSLPLSLYPLISLSPYSPFQSKPISLYFTRPSNINTTLMNLKTHYNQLWAESLGLFHRGEFRLDPQIDNKSDTRYGLTLLARPSVEIRHSIAEVLEDIKAAAPAQYYYPPSDMHITVLSIISCRPGFSLDEISPEKYADAINTALQSVRPFNISFRGLTASSSALMICGYPERNVLNEIRDQLREGFKKTSLHHTIDKRYPIHTAHSTVIRFRKKLSSPEIFLQKIQQLKNTYFGTFTIEAFELVGNDWYQRKEKVKQIQKFEL